MATTPEDPIFEAIEKGDIKAVEEYVTGHKNLSIRDLKGRCLAQAAISALSRFSHSEKHRNIAHDTITTSTQ